LNSPASGTGRRQIAKARVWAQRLIHGLKGGTCSNPGVIQPDLLGQSDTSSCSAGGIRYASGKQFPGALERQVAVVFPAWLAPLALSVICEKIPQIMVLSVATAKHSASCAADFLIQP